MALDTEHAKPVEIRNIVHCESNRSKQALKLGTSHNLEINRTKNLQTITNIKIS